MNTPNQGDAEARGWQNLMQNRAGIDTVTSSPDLEELPAIGRGTDADGDVMMGGEDSSPGGGGSSPGGSPGGGRKSKAAKNREKWEKKKADQKMADL